MNTLLLLLRNRRYLAPAWVFASLNILIGTWVLYIPYIKNKLALDDGQLGLALFFLSLGTLTAIPFVPFVIRKLGVGKATLVGITCFIVLFQFPLLSTSYSFLCGTLFVLGLGISTTDISMNALVAEIEQMDKVNVMSISHGFFSLGGVIGAGIGSLMIETFEIPAVHMLSVSAVVLLLNFIMSTYYVKIQAAPRDNTSGFFKLKYLRPLLGLAFIAFIIMGSEGAIEHWSKLYLQEVVHVTSERLAGFGFVAFSASMTIGRFFGDDLSKKLTPVVIIIGGCLVSSAGHLLVINGTYVVAIVGFGLVGIGYSVIIPELFRLAGRMKTVPSSEGISLVAGVGYVGFLLSPPLLGYLSTLESLQLSFKVLFGSCLVAVFIAFLTNFLRFGKN